MHPYIPTQNRTAHPLTYARQQEALDQRKILKTPLLLPIIIAPTLPAAKHARQQPLGAPGPLDPGHAREVVAGDGQEGEGQQRAEDAEDEDGEDVLEEGLRWSVGGSVLFWGVHVREGHWWACPVCMYEYISTYNTQKDMHKTQNTKRHAYLHDDDSAPGAEGRRPAAE